MDTKKVTITWKVLVALSIVGTLLLFQFLVFPHILASATESTETEVVENETVADSEDDPALKEQAAPTDTEASETQEEQDVPANTENSALLTEQDAIQAAIKTVQELGGINLEGNSAHARLEYLQPQGTPVWYVSFPDVGEESESGMYVLADKNSNGFPSVVVFVGATADGVSLSSGSEGTVIFRTEPMEPVQ